MLGVAAAHLAGAALAAGLSRPAPRPAIKPVPAACRPVRSGSRPA
jgi:hypothetical protein